MAINNVMRGMLTILYRLEKEPGAAESFVINT
jgi:hypothetical protein